MKEIDVSNLMPNISKASVLNLHDRSINDNDLKQIAEKLPCYPFIVGINLSKNEITKAGVLDLMDIVNQYCPNIKRLNLSFNPLDNDTFALLKDSKTLIDTEVFMSNIDNEYQIELKAGNVINKKHWKAKIALLTRAGATFFQGCRQERCQLSKLDSTLIKVIVLYLADVNESSFHMTLLTLMLSSIYFKKNMKPVSINTETALQQLSISDLIKACHMTNHFFPGKERRYPHFEDIQKSKKTMSNCSLL